MSDVQVAFLLAAIFLTGFFVWLARHNSLAAGICLIAAIAELCIGIIAWRKSKGDIGSYYILQFYRSHD